jgi:hypothetical protein
MFCGIAVQSQRVLLQPRSVGKIGTVLSETDRSRDYAFHQDSERSKVNDVNFMKANSGSSSYTW